MAFSRRKLKKRYKGVKWIDTRFAKPFKARQLMCASLVQGLSWAAQFQLDQIRGHAARTPLERAEKAAAIARVVIDSHLSFARVLAVTAASSGGCLSHEARDCCAHSG